MKRVVFCTAVIAVLAVLLFSCTSTEYHEEMLPHFYVSFTDFSSNQYDFVGNVTGVATFTVEGDASDNYAYSGILDLYDFGETMYDTLVDEAVGRAVYNLTRKARKLNANMLILPSYSVDSVLNENVSGKGGTETLVTVTVSAVAVRLLDRSGNELEVF